MAFPKLPWERLWQVLWRQILVPAVEGRLLVALDDSINNKTGRKAFGGGFFHDHTAKLNQPLVSEYGLHRSVEKTRGSVELSTAGLALLFHEKGYRGSIRDHEKIRLHRGFSVHDGTQECPVPGRRLQSRTIPRRV